AETWSAAPRAGSIGPPPCPPLPAPARLAPPAPPRRLCGWGWHPGAARPIFRGMSLPPGFLDELRNRVSLSAVVGRKVTWDMRKSNMAKGDWWSPCPFHQEKSASFHVDDRKGFY